MKRNHKISRKAICTATLTSSMFFLSSCQLFQSEPTPQIFSPRQIVPAPASAPTSSYQKVTPAYEAPKQDLAPVEIDVPSVDPVVESKPEAAVEKKIVETPKVEPVVYTVRKGDSLWKIGRRYGVSTQELASENKLNAKKHLRIGQKLTIPTGGKFRTDSEIKTSTKKPAYQAKWSTKPVLGKTKTSSKAKTTKKSSSTKKASIPASGVYTVKRGDNLWVIARRFDLRSKDIMAWNSLSSANLKIGQKLKLSGSSRASTPIEPTVPKVVVEQDPITIKTPDTPEIIVDKAPEVVEDNNTTADGEVTTDEILPEVPKEVIEPEGELVPVEVYEGDTLESIAQDFSSTVELIKAANPSIKSNADLKEGMMLKIPLKE